MQSFMKHNDAISPDPVPLKHEGKLVLIKPKCFAIQQWEAGARLLGFGALSLFKPAYKNKGGPVPEMSRIIQSKLKTPSISPCLVK